MMIGTSWSCRNCWQMRSPLSSPSMTSNNIRSTRPAAICCATPAPSCTPATEKPLRCSQPTIIEHISASSSDHQQAGNGHMRFSFGPRVTRFSTKRAGFVTACNKPRENRSIRAHRAVARRAWLASWCQRRRMSRQPSGRMIMNMKLILATFGRVVLHGRCCSGGTASRGSALVDLGRRSPRRGGVCRKNSQAVAVAGPICPSPVAVAMRP